MQMIKILWSIHNSAWLLIWMDMLFDRRKYIDSDKKFILTIFLSGMLWYGLQKYLSWIPLLLLLTILGYLLWNGSVEKVASLVVSYVFIWTVLLGLVEHFWTNAEFCAQVGWLVLNGILISAIRHKGIGKTFTALNLLWKCNSELRFPVLPGESASYGMLLLPPIATEDANFCIRYTI